MRSDNIRSVLGRVFGHGAHGIEADVSPPEVFGKGSKVDAAIIRAFTFDMKKQTEPIHLVATPVRRDIPNEPGGRGVLNPLSICRGYSALAEYMQRAKLG